MAHERWELLGVNQQDIRVYRGAEGRRRRQEDQPVATIDPAYERKLVRGEIESSWLTLTDTQANALLNGRYRGDSRTLDDYVTDEPIGISIGRFDD